MAVGPGPIGLGPFRCGQRGAVVAVPCREGLRVDHAEVGDARDVEHLGRVLRLEALRALQFAAGRLLRGIIDAKQFRRLVQQRDVRHRPARRVT